MTPKETRPSTSTATGTSGETASPVSRRSLLKTAASLTATALVTGLPIACKKRESALRTAGGAGASEGPEVTRLKLGMIALTDCSPLVIAEKKGFFKKYGVDVTVDKKANWAAIRDTLISGEIQGTHMLIGMP